MDPFQEPLKEGTLPLENYPLGPGFIRRRTTTSRQLGCRLLGFRAEEVSGLGGLGFRGLGF